MKSAKISTLWRLCEKNHWNRGTAWNKEAARLYHKFIAPELGEIPVSSIRYSHVSNLKHKMINNQIQANRVISVLSKMLNIAEQEEWRPIASNPCQRLKRYPEEKRSIFATSDVLARLGPALEDEKKNSLRAVVFLTVMLYSGARPSEVAKMEWNMIESLPDGSGILRIAGKTGPRKVFLPVQAMASLGLLPRVEGPIIGLPGVPRKMWARIKKKIGAPNLWARDLRRTFASVGYSAGVPIGVLGEALGQKTVETTKIYAKCFDTTAAVAVRETADRIERMVNV